MSRTPASTAQGREAIAAPLRAIGARFGATLNERHEPAGYGSGASIHLNFTLNGVGAQITVSDLHERHGHPGGLISWYNTNYPARNFSPGFNTAVGETSSYRRPHHKATSSDRWDVLAARLQAGLRHASNDTAWEPNQ